MIGVDTNVIVRLIADDDPMQSETARKFVAKAPTHGLFISLVVMAELAWVLKRGYKYTPDQVLAVMRTILEAREFFVEKRQLAEQALEHARAAGCGYADALIDLISASAGCKETATFDLKAKRLPTMKEVVSLI